MNDVFQPGDIVIPLPIYRSFGLRDRIGMIVEFAVSNYSVEVIWLNKEANYYASTWALDELEKVA